VIANPREPGPVRVLFLSGLQIHPTQSGGTLRTFGLANALQHHGLQVFVYSLVGRKREYLARRPSSIERWPGGLEEYVERGLWSFLAGYGSYTLGLPPVWLTAYLRARARFLPSLLREKLAWSDVVVADFPFTYPIFRAPAARARKHVLSTHNVEHHLLDDPGHWQNRWTRERVRRIELAAAEASDVLVSCSTGDQQFFEAHAKVRRSIVVPNGIDGSRFAGIEARRAETREALGIASDGLLLLFTGSKWGPNREAFEYLLAFAQGHADLLEREKIHLLVVGNVTSEPVRLPGFTATGKVDMAEPYFAAADAALNPINSGAGTNVKMGEFLAVRLPILTTSFGARGFRIDDGRTGFAFEREDLASTLVRVRRLFDEDPGRLRQIAEDAYRENASSVDMDECVRPLVAALEKPS
jgi:glycosyltransferase involved in cell wall biosynthesis